MRPWINQCHEEAGTMRKQKMQWGEKQKWNERKYMEPWRGTTIRQGASGMAPIWQFLFSSSAFAGFHGSLNCLTSFSRSQPITMPYMAIRFSEMARLENKILLSPDFVLLWWWEPSLERNSCVNGCCWVVRKSHSALIISICTWSF